MTAQVAGVGLHFVGLLTLHHPPYRRASGTNTEIRTDWHLTESITKTDAQRSPVEAVHQVRKHNGC